VDRERNNVFWSATPGYSLFSLYLLVYIIYLLLQLRIYAGFGRDKHHYGVYTQVGQNYKHLKLMKILLDIDGVLVTTPAWKPVELLPNGFLKFNEKASKNLAKLIAETKASIVLTSTHRINYTIIEWHKLFETRGIIPSSIFKVNDNSTVASLGKRANEIEEWVKSNKDSDDFVVIDDDLSLNGLPKPIKDKCVLTKPMIGLDEEAMNKAFKILLEK